MTLKDMEFWHITSNEQLAVQHISRVNYLFIYSMHKKKKESETLNFHLQKSLCILAEQNAIFMWRTWLLTGSCLKNLWAIDILWHSEVIHYLSWLNKVQNSLLSICMSTPGLQMNMHNPQFWGTFTYQFH